MLNLRRHKGKRIDNYGSGTFSSSINNNNNNNNNTHSRGSTTSLQSIDTTTTTNTTNTFSTFNTNDEHTHEPAFNASDPFLTTITTEIQDSMTNVTDLSHLEFIASQQPETRGTITRSKFELALHTLAGRRFLAEVQRQLWARLPNESRSQVRHQRCEQTALEVFRLEKLVFQPGVTNLFIKYKPKQKFNMWRRAVSKRKTKNMAKLYRWKKNVSFGLYCLMEHVKAKKRKKRLDWLADRHAGKSIQSEGERASRIWKHYS